MPLEIKPPVICALPEKSAFVLELMKFTIFILLELEAGTLRYTVENLHVHWEKKKSAFHLSVKVAHHQANQSHYIFPRLICTLIRKS